MGFYRDRVLPHLQNSAMGRRDLREVRARVCAGLEGDVVEVGFGTGLNVPYYARDVARVAAVEPSSLCVRIAEPRIAASHATVHVAGITAERLELPSSAFDSALSTWSLCTIPDVNAALREIHRLLKHGAAFHFVEHGRAPDARVFRWQARIEPAWKHVAGGCHVTRDIPALIMRAGFEITQLTSYYMKGEPRVFAYTFEGIASKT